MPLLQPMVAAFGLVCKVKSAPSNNRGALRQTSFHVLLSVVPHVDLDSPGTVGHLLHHVEIGSGMKVPVRCAVRHGPTHGIQPARERHCLVPANLVDSDVQLCDCGG